VSTDRIDTFAIATGPVDEMTEAVYFLDFRTGELNAVVIGRGAGIQVLGAYHAKVIEPLKLEASTDPKFLMVTGMTDLARGGRLGAVQPSKAVVYVAEVTSGRCAAFGIPFNKTAFQGGKFVTAPLVHVLTFPFRNAAAPGAGGGKAKAAKEE
jgi:hypothetical protein